MNTNQIIDPPSGVTWQETADGGTITIQMAWWQLMAWGLLWLSGNMAGFWLLRQLYTPSDNSLGDITLVGLIGVNIVFWLKLVNKIPNSICFTINKQFLVIDGPSHRRFSREEISQVYGTRQFKTGPTTGFTYDLMVGTSTKVEDITTDPLILRYVIGKLRYELNLPDTPTPNEYIPYIESKCHLKSLSFKSILGDIFAVLLALLMCGWPHYFLQFGIIDKWQRQWQVWQKLKIIQESHQETTATIMEKYTRAVDGLHDMVSYTYTVTLSDGRNATFWNREEVIDSQLYRRISPLQQVKVWYSTRQPSISYLASQFPTSFAKIEQEFYYFFTNPLTLSGMVVIVGVMVMRLYNIGLAYQLNRHGKIITGVVTAVNKRSWVSEYKGQHRSRNACDVYYHYLDYEGHFGDYWGCHQGQLIDICYLPHKPHISRPHPLEKYYVYSIRTWLEFIAFIAAAFLFMLLIFSHNVLLIFIYCVCIILIPLIDLWRKNA